LSLAPGTIVAAIGFVLGLREMRRSGEESQLAGRLNAVGQGLVFLVPGAGLIGLVITGDLVWPAAVGGLAGIGMGLAIILPLRPS
ncbi:MAG TPA: hypothetical protein VMH24_08200, partial [Candidatus Sulfotelmatobacter sp.]|nr:hypothetical protein [Candidatus Sulfotelmatobacter sp.]